MAENWAVFMLAKESKTDIAELVDEISAVVIPVLFIVATVQVFLKVRWNKAKRANITYLDPAVMFQGRR